MRPTLFLAIFVVGCASDFAPVDASVDTVVVDAIVVDTAIVDTTVDAIELVNGCSLAMAVDRTDANADRTIQIASDFYTPRCSRIRAGQTVTWTGEFSDHPLAPGILRANMVIAQPGTPITMTTSGTSKSVTFTDAGDWAFYCPSHPPGMSGVVYVEP